MVNLKGIRSKARLNKRGRPKSGGEKSVSSRGGETPRDQKEERKSEDSEEDEDLDIKSSEKFSDSSISEDDDEGEIKSD